MIRLECPNCGSRNVSEFRFGGEVHPRPSQPTQVSREEWVDYLYLRTNEAGLQKEWWHHRSGCGLWFLAARDTVTQVVEKTYLWEAGDE